jgi:hypothetical protein
MDESFSNVDDFFASCVETAIKQIESDALTFLPRPKGGVTLLESLNIGHEAEIRKEQAQTGRVGIKIELHNADDYLKLSIARVRLYANFSGARTIEIRNTNTGQLIDSFSITAMLGEIVEIPVSVSVPTSRQPLNLWIGYDSQGSPSYFTQTTRNCTSCGNHSYGRSAFVRFNGASIEAPFTRSSLGSLTHTGGLMIDYNIECDTSAYLCTISTLIGLPLLYKTAMVILEYGLRSGGQFSEQKTLNQEQNQERYIHASTEYQKYLAQNLGKAHVQTSRCFYCAPMVGIKNRLPA